MPARADDTAPMASIATSVAVALADAVDAGRISYLQAERLAGSILMKLALDPGPQVAPEPR